MKKICQILALALVLTLSLSVTVAAAPPPVRQAIEDPVPPVTVIASGDLNDDCHWALDSLGTLTLSGTGSLPDFEPYREIRTPLTPEQVRALQQKMQPWYDYHSLIQHAVVEDGITSLGAYAFSNCFNLEDVILPSSLTEIGDAAFYCCLSLREITIPDGITSIRGWTFSQCRNLERLTLPTSIINIERYAITGCTNLTDVIYSGTSTDWAQISIASWNGSLKFATIHYAGS